MASSTARINDARRRRQENCAMRHANSFACKTTRVIVGASNQSNVQQMSDDRIDFISSYCDPVVRTVRLHRTMFGVHRRADPSGGRRTRSVRARRRTVRGRSGSERLERIGQGGVGLGGAVRNRMADDSRRIIRSRGNDPCRSTCGAAQIVDGGFPARAGVRAAWIRRTVAIMEVARQRR